MKTPTCITCGTEFKVPEKTARAYPGWTPKQCPQCFAKGRKPSSSGRNPSSSGRKSAGQLARASSRELGLAPEEVLHRFDKGPFDGVFTDGACSGNPGPGGWGAVYVRDNQIVQQARGHQPHTTNNQMELTALIAGYQLLDADAAVTLYSDSQLCVNTINQWAAQWEKRGWRRKGGPVRNLELVKQAYALAQAHPHTTLRWIKAHDGSRWNEYADALATAYLREGPSSR